MTGIGFSLVSAAGPFKAGMLAAAGAVYTAPTYVTSGMPSTIDPFEIVSIGTVRIGQTPATLGTNRGREEILTLDVDISVFMGGMDDAQPACDARAWELLTLLEQQVHYTDTTLGGVVRECFLTSAEEDSSPITQGGQRGREAVINAVFTAKARISNG